MKEPTGRWQLARVGEPLSLLVDRPMRDGELEVTGEQ
jgi:hypothetical protein